MAGRGHVGLINLENRQAFRAICASWIVCGSFAEALRQTGHPEKKNTVIKWAKGGYFLPNEPWSHLPWLELKGLVNSGALQLATIRGSDDADPDDMLTEEELRVRRIIQTIPTTPAMWREWWEVGLGHNFKKGIIMAGPSRQVTDNIPHKSPIEWSFEIWCLANGRSSDGKWRKLSQKELSKVVRKILLWGNRGGMKTLALAGVWYSLCWFVPGYTTTHSATQKHQSQACLEYIRDYWAKSPHFMNHLDVNTLRAKFDNDSEMQLVTASKDGFNSDHTLSLSVDEVETLLWSILLEGLRIPMRIPGLDLPSLTILASTQKEPGATMSRLIKRAKKGEYKLYRWNAFDVVERCPKWRTDDLPKGLKCADYPSIIEMVRELEFKREHESLTGVEAAQLERLQEKAETLHDNCPLVFYCKGIAKHGTGHYAIDDILDALADDADQFEAQVMCWRPNTSNAVYSRFSSENESPEAVFRPNKRVLAAADYGFATDPAAAVIAVVNGPHLDIFEEVYQINTHSIDQAKMYKRLSDKYGIETWAVGADATELIKYMKKLGLNVVSCKPSNINKGLQRVGRLICDAAGFRTLRLHPEQAQDTVDTMQNYKKSELTNKPALHQDDHLPDAVRYLCEIYEGKRGRKSGVSGQRSPGIGSTTGGKVGLSRNNTRYRDKRYADRPAR